MIDEPLFQKPSGPKNVPQDQKPVNPKTHIHCSDYPLLHQTTFCVRPQAGLRFQVRESVYFQSNKPSEKLAFWDNKLSDKWAFGPMVDLFFQNKLFS